MCLVAQRKGMVIIMKKTLALLLMAVMCLALLGTGAMADGEEMIPVFASVPEGWENPCIWAWADDGTGAFDAWPGGEMEPVGEEGWYFCYVPGFVTNIIVNANDGSVQTEGIAVDAGKSVWITVAGDNSAEFTYDAQTTAEIPAYVEKFSVHAYVPLSWESVNMWAWSAPDGTNAFDAWPGAAMKEGEDGWFTGKAPVWVNSLIVNGNGGDVKTEDIAIEGKELWLTVYEDFSYELSYEDPATAGVEDVTVHVKVPADWAEPHAWAWSAPDGTNAFAAWPGEAMTANGDWYDVVVPGWINSFIANANEAGVQTTDLSVEPGKEAWIVITSPESAEVFYEEPGETPAEPEAAPVEAEPETAPAEAAPAAEPVAGKGNGGLIAGIVAAVAVVGGGTAAIVSKKKKK